jgi:hypothetical protein
MAGRLQAVLATLVVTGVMAVVAAGASGAEHFPLFGPYGGALCNGGGVVAGTEGGYGFAVITGTSTVRAKVTLKALSPNTTYYVRFIQGIADCGETNATFTTNSHGKGHVVVSEPSVSTHAYVFIEDGPASQFYVTQTYFHAL